MAEVNRAGLVDFLRMTPELLQQESKVKGVVLISTLVVIDHKPHEVTIDEVEKSLGELLGDMSCITIYKYGISDKPYYQAYYSSEGNRYSPITLVKVWYHL